MFEYTNQSLRGEVYSSMNSGVLELKLREVHFPDKFSKAELARLRRTCLQSSPSAVLTPMFTMMQRSTPMTSLQGKGYLAKLRVDIWMRRLKFCPFSGLLNMSTPTVKGPREQGQSNQCRTPGVEF